MTVRNRKVLAGWLKQTKMHRHWDTGTKKVDGRHRNRCVSVRWHTPHRVGRRS